MGATRQRLPKAASLRRRSGLSLGVTKRVAVLPVPIPRSPASGHYGSFLLGCQVDRVEAGEGE